MVLHIDCHYYVLEKSTLHTYILQSTYYCGRKEYSLILPWCKGKKEWETARVDTIMPRILQCLPGCAWFIILPRWKPGTLILFIKTLAPLLSCFLCKKIFSFLTTVPRKASHRKVVNFKMSTVCECEFIFIFYILLSTLPILVHFCHSLFLTHSLAHSHTSDKWQFKNLINSVHKGESDVEIEYSNVCLILFRKVFACIVCVLVIV